MRKILALMAIAAGVSATAQTLPTQNLNMPIIQTRYTADPAPVVHDGVVYLFTTHDEDGAEGFNMKDWLLYTSTDMVNWQDHGAVASLRDFKWYKGNNGAWAEQVIYRDGKWYMYCPIHGNGIGVLVADSPYGPYVDPIGKPLVWQKEHWDDIDPTVMIDDDGQAYMFWGNPNVYYVKLNKDMISYSGDIVKLPKIKDYQEGPWIWTRKNAKGEKNYYMAFASTCCPEGIGYAMSKKPEGPWEYKGHIMDHTVRTRGNHPGIIDFNGKSYCFGLNYDVFRLETSRHAEQRSVSAAEMTYNPDGTIQELPYFHDCQLNQVGTFNPFRKVEAETMAWGYGLKTTRENPSGPWNPTPFVTSIDEGEYLLVKGVNFGAGASSFTASCSSHLYGGIMELRIDSVDGQKIGAIVVPATKDVYKEFTTNLTDAKGVHDLYFVFRGGKQQKKNLFNWDWWQMTEIVAGSVTKSKIVEEGGTGPYKAIMEEIAGLPAHTVFMPQDLSKFDKKNPLPVLVWGNGACTNSPWEHFKFLNEIASQGYLVLATGFIPMEEEAYRGPQSTPEQQIESIDWAFAQNSDKNSPLYGKINTKAICISGMSCGGLQTLFNCKDKRITTYMICNSGLFINPSGAMAGMPMPTKDQLKQVHGPILYILGGETDIAYQNGMDDFHRINHVPAMAINLPVGHGGTYRQPHGGEFRFPAIAWLNWQLKGDKEAAKMFQGEKCGISQREGWTVEKNKLIDKK